VLVDDGAHQPGSIGEVVLQRHRVLGPGGPIDLAEADPVHAFGGEETLGGADEGQLGGFGVAGQWTDSSEWGYVGQQLMMQLH